MNNTSEQGRERPLLIDLDDEPLTAVKAAKALGLSRGGVLKLCRERLIEHERPTPGSIRIRRSVLEKYIRSVRVAARGGAGATG